MRATIILMACLLAACSPLRGCVESNFELAPESRLPNSIQVPADAKREDVAVSLTYYTPFSRSIDDAVFGVSVKGHGNYAISARTWWHPRTKKLLDVFYATEPRPEYPEPSYVVLEINGKIDVIEHRAHTEQNRDPYRALFWMTNDAAILQEAIDSRDEADSVQ